MKKPLRWVLRVALIVFGLLICLLLLKDPLLKSVAERRLSRKIGLRVTLGGLKVGVVSATLALKDLRIFNPPSFNSAILLSVPEASCVVDLQQVRSGLVHFHELKLHVAELNVVKNHDGVLNLSSVKDAIADNSQNSTKDKRLAFKFGGIDKLVLSWESVRYLDEQQPRNNRRFELGVQSETVTNLESEEDCNRWLTAFLIRTAFQEYTKDPPQKGRAPLERPPP